MVIFGSIPRFSDLGKSADYPRFPRGTYRHPRIIREHSTALPALNVFADRRGKRQSPCGFMMFHMCDAQKHSRQHASMADSRQNDTWPAQPNGLHLKLARASSALCHDPIISHRVRGMRNKNQFISLFLFLELSLASPTSPTTIGLIPPQFENRANMRRICHTLAVLLVCVGLLCTASGFIFDYLHPEYVSSFPSYLYLLRAVPFLIAAGVVETVFRLLKRRNKGRRNASNFPNRS